MVNSSCLQTISLVGVRYDDEMQDYDQEIEAEIDPADSEEAEGH